MSKILVLGAGMVGSAMALDLAKKHSVTAADISQEALEKLQARDGNIQIRQGDLNDKATLASVVEGMDLLINAVPGFMGYSTLSGLIEFGKPIVDISFFPEDCLELDGKAKEYGVTAIVDCGVAPGMDNLILGRYNADLDEVSDFECLVGGLPKERKWPFAYKAPFSPVDVIEEYTRPARYVEHGEIVTREALSDPELIEFEGVGTLESFNTDGLRSIMFTMSHIPNMKEKTLRYPGHIEYVRVLRETGFFGTEKVNIKGQEISPMDLTAKLLFDEWKLGDEEPELTVMRVTVAGKKDGKSVKVVYRLLDEYDPGTRTSSMARTTGYTATAAAELILQGRFERTGIFPPETIGHDEAVFDFFIQYLKERNVIYTKEISAS